tara:strand:+ start:34784 stop:35107 length:324 start_codon:yes stop_codon:yes gene_type:complete
MEWSRFALIALLASCATAGSADDDDGNVKPAADGSTFSFPDAARFDAAPVPDATPIITYDAAPIVPDAGGPFCENSNSCASDECCFSLGGPGFCVTGDEILGVCLPD